MNVLFHVFQIQVEPYVWHRRSKQTKAGGGQKQKIYLEDLLMASCTRKYMWFLYTHLLNVSRYESVAKCYCRLFESTQIYTLILLSGL